MAACVLAAVAALAIGRGVYQSVAVPAPPAAIVPAAPHHVADALTYTGEGVEVVVPRGMVADLAGGGHGFELPSMVRMETGQTIVVRNDDDYTHVVLGMAVKAGATEQRVLEAPGIEIYSAGCVAHVNPGSTGMTTLMVSAPSSDA
ncbi:MAG: hypothetical protein IT337_02715 [Thermomicrobiales bacterium]|nr:hypothetical protein [Thermomicrobiales bacterium]